MRGLYGQFETDSGKKGNRIIKVGQRIGLGFIFLFFQIFYLGPNLFGQIATEPANRKVAPNQVMPDVKFTTGLYLDQINGTTADEAVRIALENNGELNAYRDELSATQALIKQAELRPNPRVRIGGSQEGFIGNRYTAGVSVSLPLELGGRRRTRINVAEHRFKVRETMLADKERRLASEVRLKFGQAIGQIEKLRFLEELLANAEQGYKIISAKVTEGSNAPLEKNMSLVELNRIRSMREMSIASVEIKLLELRNVMGLETIEPLRLKGDFENLLTGFPPISDSVDQAIQRRPDLKSLRLMRELGNARLEESRAAGRIDAGVSLGFQRLTRVSPQISSQNPVELTPQLVGENFITFGMDLMLPITNKNQGAIESAAFEIKAAEKRIEFGELTVRREVVAAYRRYNRAARALAIYEVGVRNQAKQNLLVIWQTYEFGDKDLLDYIAEERRYLQLENDLTDAELEVYLARIEIYRSINAPELITK